MKKITKLLAVGCLASSFLMTGCIDETFPTNAATEDQVTSSDESAAAMLWSLHAQLNTPVFTVGDYHFDFGYGAMMHIRDVQTGDMPINASNYDQFWIWEENQAQGKAYLYGQMIWNYYYRCVLACNKLIGAFPLEEATDEVKGYIAAAHAYRALFYLDLARLYEYMPATVDKGSYGPSDDAGNDVTGLTVPIVTEATTEEDAYNNPRATREEMATFILGDLQAAEENIGLLTESFPCLPHLDVVYGLYARYYMWLGRNLDDTSNPEAYVQARDYARKAINASSTQPMTEEECLSTSKGFNNIDCWMLGSQLVKENDVVQTGIINWISWMSNETSFGYCGMAGAPWSQIDARLYDRADNNDFRKRMWKAPESNPALADKTDYLTSTINGYFGTFLPAYASVKFRPGEGNPDDVNLAASVAYPMMRVEEMYFIEAEAAEQVTPGAGKQLLEAFMNNYRIAEDAEGYRYTCTNTNVIDEIIAQKRIELWGEGQSFFDYKRLNMSVDRTYSGSNWSATTRFKTTGRPAWMNYVIVQSEENSNAAVRGWNNPDPSGKYNVIPAE